jgi:hypothetical protein
MFDFTQEVTELVREKMYSHLNVNNRRANTGKVNVRCFICGDSKKDRTKKRGWIYFPSGEQPNYSCFNDGCSAIGINLLAKIQGIDKKEAFSQVLQRYRDRNDDDYISDEAFFLDDDGFEEFMDKPQETEKPARDEFIIPENWRDLDEKSQKIVDSRKIMEAPYAPKKWKLYLCTKTSRIVIPWIKDGKIESYQLRAIYKNQEPKYKFEADIDKPIFGLDTLDYDHPYVYLIEGAFDSIFVKNGLAIGGIRLSSKQQDTMENYMFDHVYMLDNQWVDESAYKETHKLLKDGKSVFIWPSTFKSKDVNEHIVKTGKNPFNDPKFLEENTFTGLKGIIHFKFLQGL